MSRRSRIWTSVTVATLGMGVAALPVHAATATASASKITIQKVCTTGFYQCLSYVRTDLPRVTNAEAAHDGLTPGDLHSAYKLPMTGGNGATVAVVDAYDDPNAEADLNVYRSYYHLGACTTKNGCFKKVNENGQSSPLPRPDPDWSLEESLDLDMVSAICPHCHILFVEADSADETSTTNDKSSDLGHAAATAATFPGVVAISNSYASVGVEPDETNLNFEYNHPGIAVTVSSGDEGYGAEWPASSPDVIAVGGTSLAKAKNSRGWTETTWSSPTGVSVPEVFGATGSGCSMWEPKPAWQKDKGCTGRTISDVSAVADPNTGVAIYDSYPASGTPITGWTVVGGTSVSSPIIGAVYGLAGNHGVTSSRNVSLRYPASRLYARTPHLYDVTSGSNFVPQAAAACSGGTYVCVAGKGYDGPTGNGTPNGLKAFQP